MPLKTRWQDLMTTTKFQATVRLINGSIKERRIGPMFQKSHESGVVEAARWGQMLASKPGIGINGMRLC